MNRLLKRPIQRHDIRSKSKYNCFSLTENPFPTSPVNKDSKDPRINGKIYEAAIRTSEFTKIVNTHLKRDQTDPCHPRLGYICDTSYIGRGNGKSAFLVNLIDQINFNYCLDISDDLNKCFALYVVPESGGRTKTFSSFVDLIFASVYDSGIISTALASLRLDSLLKIQSDFEIQDINEKELITSLNSEAWFEDNGLEISRIQRQILDDEYLQQLPDNFPLVSNNHTLIKEFITEKHFESAYVQLKTCKDKLDYIFSHLVNMFLAAGFNGAYIFVDDFERVPDFQSGRQKRDFATELRSVLLDGPYANSRYGFFNMFLVLHAGVPALISEAWTSSGLDHRYPLSPKIESENVIRFERIERKHVHKLIKKYLLEYRLSEFIGDPLAPFTMNALNAIAESSEYNAASILRICYELVEKAVELKIEQIDESFVTSEMGGMEDLSSDEEPSLNDLDSTDLLQKAQGNSK